MKAIDRGDILRDVKAINPNIRTALRHYGGPQNIFDGRGYEAYKRLAREFYATFIDETFRQQYARFADIVIEWNEYLASSHTGQELQDRIDWARAAAWVWRHEYRTQPEYAHIRLALLSAPVGNDIHRVFAEIALEHDCVLSYHAYDKFIGDHQRDPLSWRYHCGRWAYMEQSWGGLKPDWMFGEAGPYAGVLQGWRHPTVLNGDAAAYVEAVRTWIRELRGTPAYQEGRVLGFNLFTTGGTSEWQHYETKQPEMDMLAAMIRQEWFPVAPPDPEPEPEPEPEPRRYAKEAHLIRQGLPRRQRIAVMDAAAEQMQSVFWSADDWALTLQSSLATVTARRLHAWNIDEILGLPEPEARRAIEDWVGLYYPDPPPEFIYHRIRSLFTAHTWRSPVGTEQERGSGQIWPGAWIDATGYLTRYRLGSGWAIHTGADLNLNAPVFDMDRNKPVYAAASGKVTYAGVPSHGWQGVVVMRHQDTAGAVIAYTRYAHLQPDEITVRAEDWVKVGEVVGLTGRNMTGDTPGPFHLHFDVSTTGVLLNDPGHWPGDNLPAVRAHYVDPKLWLQSRR